MSVISDIREVIFLALELFREVKERRPLKNKWEEVRNRVQTARERVWILQTWLPFLRGELEIWRKVLEKEKLEFRVLLIDPNLAWARTICRGGYTDMIEQNTKDINLIDQETAQNRGRGTTFEGKFYSCIPFGPIYIIDDWAYWGLYLAHMDSQDGPVFAARTRTTLGKHIEDSYKAVWDTFDYRSGDLELPSGIRARMTRGVIDPRIDHLRGSLMPVAEQDIRQFASQGGVLAVIRHGQTDLNRASIFAGNLDVPINTEGRKAASGKAKVTAGIKWNRVLRSPLRRTKQTLEHLLALAGGIPEVIEIHEVLRERRMGDVEGLHKEKYVDSFPKYQQEFLTTSLYAKASGGGESYVDVFNRMAKLFDEHIVPEVKQGHHILICCREGPMRMIDMAICGLSEQEALSAQIDNCQFLCYRAP